jgi:hypothetical protein
MLRTLCPLFLALTAIPLFADADLRLAVGQSTQIHNFANGTYEIDAAVFNKGPDTARNVRVTFDFPAALLIQYTNPGGKCDTAHRPVVCTMGDVPPTTGPSAQGFTVGFILPPQGGTVTYTVIASSDTPDPEPDDNIFHGSVNVENLTYLYVADGTTPSRVDPGGTTVVTTEIRNWAPSNPQNIHVHYDAVDATIEKLSPSSRWTCTGDATSADCTAPALDEGCRCTRDLSLTLRVKNDRAGGKALLNTTVTTSLADISGPAINLPATIPIYRWLTVTSTADSGAGSLRDAITQANAGCNDPCRIAFEIPGPVPASGWFTIAPSTPLPPITADRVIVDGTTQTAFTGDTNPAGPEIFLDGRFTASGHGLEVRSRCDAVVQGLSIGNFSDHGLALPSPVACSVNDSADQHLVTHNYLGVDPSGVTAAPNLRGLLAENGCFVTGNVISSNRNSGVWAWRGSLAVNGNTITNNGRSGIFFGPLVTFSEALDNTISFNREMGVAIAREAQLVDVRQNSMRGNGGLGIDIGLDGPNAPVADDSGTQPNPPTMLSAVYDPALKMTIVTVSLVTKFPKNFGNTTQLDFYANDGPNGQGEQWIGTGDSSVTNRGLALRGDFRGKWINATNTRIHFEAALPPSSQSIGSKSIAGGQTTTSELGNSILVQ